MLKKLNFDIQDVNIVDDGIWTIGKMFADPDFAHIQHEVTNVPDKSYQPSPAFPTERFELTWMLDGVLEELTEAFKEQEAWVSETIGTPVKFGQVRVWRDHPGFMIPFHEDDKVSAAHIQIYIDGPIGEFGTTWYTPKGRFTCPFVFNSGYLTVCEKRLPHGLLKPVEGQVRYSLYATFAKAA